MSALLSLFLFVAAGVFFVFGPPVARKIRFANARKAEADGRFADAYELFGKIVFTASKSFALPTTKTLTSSEDVQKWIAKSVAAYTTYLMNKPQPEELRMSVGKLAELEVQLEYVESKLVVKPEESQTLSLESYRNILKSLYFPNQKQMPPKTSKDAAALLPSRYRLFLSKVIYRPMSRVASIIMNEMRALSLRLIPIRVLAPLFSSHLARGLR